MPSITLRQLDFNYDSPHAEVFRHLELLIDTGWRTGLIGRNGQGKSTLLRLIAGSLAPLAGALDVPVATRYFPVDVDPRLLTRDAIKDAMGPFRQWEQRMESLLEAGDEPSLARFSEIHEAYLARNGYQVNANIERETTAIGLPLAILQRPFHTLSGGEQTRALIVGLFADEYAYPLIDEPTNHLDMAGREILQCYLAGKPGFLLVSHDRRFLDGAVDHIVSINKSDVRVNRGNYTSWRQHMDEELLNEQRTRENLEREVRQLARAARNRRRGADSREGDKYGNRGVDTGFIGHRAAKQMKKAITFERRIEADLEAKRQLLKNKEKEREVKFGNRSNAAEGLVTIQNVSLGFGARTLIAEFSLMVGPGDRIAVTGANGSGKTTLFNAIAGEIECTAGTITKPGWVDVSRAYQQPRWTAGMLRDKLDANGIDETRFRQYMGVFGVGADVFGRDLSTFSQGQLKKVDLIRSMMPDADLLLWDEPLNYVDLYSREQLERAIVSYEPTMLFTEHDRVFVEKVATRIVSLDDFREHMRDA